MLGLLTGGQAVVVGGFNAVAHTVELLAGWHHVSESVAHHVNNITQKTRFVNTFLKESYSQGVNNVAGAAAAMPKSRQNGDFFRIAVRQPGVAPHPRTPLPRLALQGWTHGLSLDTFE
jgi:hypothetical protein